MTLLAFSLGIGGLQMGNDDHPKVPPAPDGVRLSLMAIPENARKNDGSWRPNYRLRYVNQSRRDIVIYRYDFYANHRVVVRDEWGHEPTLTKQGLTNRENLIERFGERDHNIPQVIKPGESFDESMKLDIRTLYSLPPGRYSLQVDYYEQLGYPMTMTSNKLTVTVPPEFGSKHQAAVAKAQRG